MAKNRVKWFVKKMYKKFVKIYSFILLVSVGSVFFVPARQALADRTTSGDYPRLANLFLRSPINRAEAEKLSQWDVVVLNMLAQDNSAELIRYMRQRNPGIIILAYLPSEEFAQSRYQEWDPNPNGLMRKLFSGITDDMWLRDGAGNHVAFWQDFWMLNGTNYTPAYGQRWNEYLSDFAVRQILSSGLWDGIFYDNVWTGVSWINGGKIDGNRDGQNDGPSLDRNWNAGMSTLFNLTRQKAGKNIILVGNGDRGFYGDLNGLYYENFTRAALPWSEKMRLYSLAAGTSRAPVIAIVGNTSLPGKNQTDYQNMRFGLSSALLQNGYYSFDDGSNSHAEAWWYDEYNANIGQPSGAATSLAGLSQFKEDVWRREYTNGVALVNATNQTQDIELGGEYEKLIGTQDPSVNNGMITDRVTIPSRDGLIMYRTFKSLDNSVFTNGAFARFFDAKGQRARNGFFLFEEGVAGGVKVYKGDLDGNGKAEKIIITGPKVEIFDSFGQSLAREYPFGAGFKGIINAAVGRLSPGEKASVVLAPSKGGQLVVYNYSGVLMQKNIYPLGKKYQNGFSLSIANVGENSLITLGTGRGRAAEILEYNLDAKKIIKRFYPFEKNYLGGVSVAAGDFNGDGKDEFAVASGVGKKPVIRVFNASGKKLSEFIVGGIFSAQGASLPGAQSVGLTAVDLAGEGRDEIVVLSNQ